MFRKPSTRLPCWERIAATARRCSTPTHLCKCGQVSGTTHGNATRPSWLDCIKLFTRVGPKLRRLGMLVLWGFGPCSRASANQKRDWHRSLDTAGTEGTARCGDCESGLPCDTDRCSAHDSTAVSRKSHVLVAQARWRRETHRASIFVACPLEHLPCRCCPCLGCGQRAVLGLCGQRVQCFGVRNPLEITAGSGGHRASPRHQCAGIFSSSMTLPM